MEQSKQRKQSKQNSLGQARPDAGKVESSRAAQCGSTRRGRVSIVKCWRCLSGVEDYAM